MIMRNGYVIVNNIQVSIILMYPVEGRYLDIPIKLKIQIIEKIFLTGEGSY